MKFAVVLYDDVIAKCQPVAYHTFRDISSFTYGVLLPKELAYGRVLRKSVPSSWLVIKAQFVYAVLPHGVQKILYLYSGLL